MHAPNLGDFAAIKASSDCRQNAQSEPLGTNGFPKFMDGVMYRTVRTVSALFMLPYRQTSPVLIISHEIWRYLMESTPIVVSATRDPEGSHSSRADQVWWSLCCLRIDLFPSDLSTSPEACSAVPLAVCLHTTLLMNREPLSALADCFGQRRAYIGVHGRIFSLITERSTLVDIVLWGPSYGTCTQI